MSKAIELISLLERSDLVCELKKLKKILDKSPNGLKAFQNILVFQKKIVHNDQTKNNGLDSDTVLLYHDKFASFKEYPVVAQYINQTEELQMLVKEIQDILNNGLTNI
ncbi:MAG: YlbF family regulator [Candidatus Izemoplasmatales bacterium]